MPLEGTKSRSVPSSPIPDRRPAEIRKTASWTGIRGELRAPDSIRPFHLAEPEESPGTAGSRHGSGSRAQLSEHQAELVSVSGSVQVERDSISPPPGNASQEAVPTQSPPAGPPEVSATRPSQSLSQPDISTSDSTRSKASATVASEKTPSSDSTTSEASATAVSKKTPSQADSKLVKEMIRLIMQATLDQLQETHGDLTKLAGFNKSSDKAALASSEPLLKIFRDNFSRITRGGSIFPSDLKENLIKSIETGAERPQKTKTSVERPQKKKSSQAAGGIKQAKKKETSEWIPGLQDMFLTRAVNHLITGELYMLDPMIGDEGCQNRTPFILDMHRLVQEKMPKNAVELVRNYREKTDSVQTRVLEQLKGLEAKRKDKDEKYDSEVSDFVKANPLEESMRAKSGDYEAMLTELTSAIERQHPEAAEYLKHACSEGSVYWEDVLDPFGLSMLTDRHPVFPNTMLAGRKMKQSELSKDYLVKSASELVRMEGGTVREEGRRIGFDKSGKIQASPSFLMAQSKKDSMPAMLLHALQLHSGAAVTKGKRQLELLPYWETTRLALTHALKKGYPLIVNLRRLTVSGEGNERQYSGNVCKTLFYEPTDEGYRYQPHPSAEQQSQGALLFQGYSMLRKGDTDIPGATLPIAPWVFKEDPKEFLDGFTKCDVANLMLLGDVGTHHPLNTGAGSFAYGPPDGEPGIYSFANDPGGWKYVDAIHDRTLSDLGQARMTQQGQEYLTPDFELTDKSKGMVFPDECPVNISGRVPGFNLKEEHQLVKQLGVAAGMKDTMYSKEHKDGTAERVAQSTMPFISTHILASTFAHENEVSTRFASASPETRGVTERLDELRKK